MSVNSTLEAGGPQSPCSCLQGTEFFSCVCGLCVGVCVCVRARVCTERAGVNLEYHSSGIFIYLGYFDTGSLTDLVPAE